MIKINDISCNIYMLNPNVLFSMFIFIKQLEIKSQQHFQKSFISIESKLQSDFKLKFIGIRVKSHTNINYISFYMSNHMEIPSLFHFMY